MQHKSRYRSKFQKESFVTYLVDFVLNKIRKHTTNTEHQSKDKKDDSRKSKTYDQNSSAAASTAPLRRHGRY